MATVRVNNLPLATSIDLDDRLYFTDISDESVDPAGRVKQIEVEDAVITPSGTQNISNKSFEDSTTTFHDNADTTKKMRFEASGVTAGQTRVLTSPDYNGTIATLAGTETLTNKTLTSPTVNTPVVNGGTFDSPELTDPVIMGWDGWQDADESWAYASWTAGTRIGTITVPTDATTKYSAGMRIRISQSTGGTKYGIVHKVEATTLTVFFPSGVTLNNEAISSPHYSTQKAPYGFSLLATDWMLSFGDTTARTQGSPVTNTWYNVGTSLLAVGIGLYDVRYSVVGGSQNSSAATDLSFETTLSTANNSVSDNTWTRRWSYRGASAARFGIFSMEASGRINVTTASTYYLNIRATDTSGTLYYNNANSQLRIEFVSAYL